jgi:putative membrane protein
MPVRHAVFESFAGFDDFLVYLAMSLAFLAIFVAVYVRITPYRELALIRENNMAAAFSLSGSLLGFIVPLAATVRYSVSLVDMAVWALIALGVQLCAYVAVKLMVPTLAQDIQAGRTAQGFFLGTFSLGVGLLNAACMSY